jgi:vancomycin resistance protein VanJ
MTERQDLAQPTLQQRLWALLLAACDVYAALLVLFLPLRTLFGDRPWPVALLSTVLHWVLLPVFVLLPVTLWARRWLTAAMLGVNAAVFLWLFGGLFLPIPPAPAEAHVLTVMTYNVADKLTPPHQLVDTLRASEADIIALQELTAEQAAAIEQGLRDLYPHQVLYGRGIPGKGILSRYPILEEELFYLQAQRLPHLRATVAVSDAKSDPQTTAVTVIIAHPPPPGISRGTYRVHPHATAEIASLVQMATAGKPSILLGDFNLTDQSDNYALLTDAGLTDAFRAAGWGFGTTWPVQGIGPLRLLVRVDYIWHSAHFRAVHCWVGSETASDHLPVLVQLAWQR